MRVEILTTIEDSNEFDLDEPLGGAQAFSLGHRRYKRHIARVDKLQRGRVVDLPSSQAENLIRLGYAKAV